MSVKSSFPCWVVEYQQAGEMRNGRGLQGKQNNVLLKCLGEGGDLYCCRYI